MALQRKELKLELSERSPHTRVYWKDGLRADVQVNDHGVVECSEELFDVLLRVAGYHETDPPADIDSLPLSVLGEVGANG
jgi:hypothetical protein